MEYSINIQKDKYNLAALKIINCFLKLTNYELELVSKMMDNNIIILSTQDRIKLRELTGKDINTTNNYIKRLKDKKILLKTDKGLELNKSIQNLLNDNEIKIRFNVN